MTDRHSDTVETYNRSAAKMAQHFQQYADGIMREEIGKTFSMIGNKPDARVVEIGCGAGKDAAEIVKHCSWYEGFDPAGELLKIGRANLPEISFVQADAVHYNYPKDLDAVFAFASMLHLSRGDFAKVCAKISEALRPGGAFCLTLKEADEYQSSVQQDKFGTRTFYFYNPSLVRRLAGSDFEQVYEAHQRVGPEKKRWFTVILRKVK